jgi:hypothetical protein
MDRASLQGGRVLLTKHATESQKQIPRTGFTQPLVHRSPTAPRAIFDSTDGSTFWVSVSNSLV